MATIINNNGEGRKRPTGARLRSWRPELPDARDRRFVASGAVVRDRVASLGKARGVRVHDQAYTSACTGFAVTTAVETSFGLKGDAGQLAPLHPYYWGRFAIGETHLDMGAYNRDVVKSVQKNGLPTLSKWRFTTANITKLPSAQAEKDAAARRDAMFVGMEYRKCDNLEMMIAAINDGCGIVFGALAYEKLFGLNKSNFIYTMPEAGEQIAGGHAMCADGYSVRDRFIEVSNSWGLTWGNAGRFRMPFDWFADSRRLVDDVWAIVPANRIAPA